MDLAVTLQNFSSHLGFRARPIESSDARKAYALARLNRPELSIAEWSDMISWQRQSPIGDCLWIAIEDLRSYVHALFFCHLIHPIRRNPVLRITDLITAELPGPSIIASAVECATFLANGAGAAAVEFDFEGNNAHQILAGIATQLKEGGWLPSERTVLRFRPQFH